MMVHAEARKSERRPVTVVRRLCHCNSSRQTMFRTPSTMGSTSKVDAAATRNALASPTRLRATYSWPWLKTGLGSQTATRRPQQHM